MIKIGNKGQIKILMGKNESPIYLYSHWGASELIKNLQIAMQRNLRWDDPSYLARIIFCQMVKDDLDGETGYGIDTYLHSDIWRLLIVDCENQLIIINDRDTEAKHYSFQNFCNFIFKKEI